jgi:hypothetical protein
VTQLLEYVKQTGPFKVDRENAIIYGVKVIDLESANNRSYLKEAVGNAINAGLYEKKATNIDHPSRPGESTTVARRNGWLENVQQEASGGGRGDWHLIKSHPMTEMILEIAERAPWLLGLSHNASGKTRRDGKGKEIVEAIEAVHSVDCVADPATVKGLHEGKEMTTTVKQLIESLKTTRPGYARGLREMAEAGLMSPDAAMDAPTDMPASEAPPEKAEETDHEQAILDAAKACLDDTSLSAPEKLVKIKKLLGIIEDKPDDAEPAATEESRRAAAANLREMKALRLIAVKGLRLTPLAEMALKGAQTDADVQKIVEGLETPSRGQAPRSATPTNGQRAGAALTEGAIPSDTKGALEWLKG